jgi:hypothetical protein
MKHDTDILKRIKSYFMRRKSADEAHTFEREVEKDPFLYEAMEGFEGMLTSDIQQAMDELDDRLEAQSNKFIWTINWRIAASILAIFTIGISLYFSVFRNTEDHRMSESEDSQLYKARDTDLLFDTLGSYAFDQSETAADSIDNEDSMENSIAQSNQPVLTTPIEESRNDTRDKAKTEENTYAWESDNDVAASDAIQASEDAIEIEAELEESAFLDESIAAMPQKEEAKRAVTMGATEAISQSKARVSEESSSISVVKPIGGMVAYQSYLKKNLNSSEGMPTGTVVITFELDRSGNPKKISVAKSLCTACDAEAIRLVENGPKWESEDRKATGSVVIQFP